MSFDDEHCTINLKSKSMVSVNHHNIRPRIKRSLPLIQRGLDDQNPQLQKLKKQIKAINVRLKGQRNSVIHSLIPKANNLETGEGYRVLQKRRRSQTLLSEYYSSLEKMRNHVRSQILLTPNIRRLENIRLNQNKVKEYLNQIQKSKNSERLKTDTGQMIINICPSRQALVYNYQQQIQQKQVNKNSSSLEIPKKSSRQPALKISPMPLILPKFDPEMQKPKRIKINKIKINLNLEDDQSNAPNNTMEVRGLDRIQLIDQSMREKLQSYSLNFCKRKKLKDLSYSILKKQYQMTQEGISPWQSHTQNFLQTQKP